MQFRPMNEVVRDIQYSHTDAKEESEIEVARKMLDEDFSAEIVRKCTGTN